MVNILYRFGATKIVAVAVWMTMVIEVKLILLVAINLMVLIKMSKSRHI